MKIILDGGPMDGEEMEIPEPYPWLRVPVLGDYPDCFNYEEGKPVTLRSRVALYRAIRYVDGRFGYLFDGMD